MEVREVRSSRPICRHGHISFNSSLPKRHPLSSNQIFVRTVSPVKILKHQLKG